MDSSSSGRNPRTKRAVSHTGDDRGGSGNGDSGDSGGDNGGVVWSKRDVSHTGNDGVPGGGGGHDSYIVKRDVAHTGNDRGDDGGGSDDDNGQGGDDGHGGGGGGDGNDGHDGTSITISSNPLVSPQRRALEQEVTEAMLNDVAAALVRGPHTMPWSPEVARRADYQKDDSSLHHHGGRTTKVAEEEQEFHIMPLTPSLQRRSSGSDSHVRENGQSFDRRGVGSNYFPSGTGSGNTYDKGQPFGRSL
ncbi:hypothetical protein BGW41_000201 [Actinomortierella wolfii]|nr:hypothetical protein BGW41_000201 [Actinomortierella wolfii]